MRKQLEQLVIVPKCAATAVAKKTEICPDRRSVGYYLTCPMEIQPEKFRHK